MDEDSLLDLLQRPEFTNTVREARPDGPLRITIPRELVDMEDIEPGDRLRLKIMQHDKNTGQEDDD